MIKKKALVCIENLYGFKITGTAKPGVGGSSPTSRCSGGIKVIVRNHKLLAAVKLGRYATLSFL